jgi:hypothetical protein
MKANNSIVSGDSGNKTHLSSYTLIFKNNKWFTRPTMNRNTQCKSVSIQKESFNEFHATYKSYPETCCKKCVALYLETMSKNKTE